MANDLKNRARLGITLKKELHKELKDFSKESMIPISKLMDRAVELLLEDMKKK